MGKDGKKLHEKSESQGIIFLEENEKLEFVFFLLKM
jgi:hypothetical protein